MVFAKDYWWWFMVLSQEVQHLSRMKLQREMQTEMDLLESAHHSLKTWRCLSNVILITCKSWLMCSWQGWSNCLCGGRWCFNCCTEGSRSIFPRKSQMVHPLGMQWNLVSWLEAKRKGPKKGGGKAKEKSLQWSANGPKSMCNCLTCLGFPAIWIWSCRKVEQANKKQLFSQST